MLHVTSCFWCFGLELGSRLIAYIHLIVAMCFVVLCSIYAEKFRELVGTVEDAGDNVYSTWYKIAIIVAVISSVHVMLAFTLLRGVHKRSTVLLRAWVYVMSALWVAAIVLNVVVTIMFGINGSGSDIFLAFLEALLFFGITAYFILCVHSFYLMLKSSEDMEGPSGKQY